MKTAEATTDNTIDAATDPSLTMDEFGRTEAERTVHDQAKSYHRGGGPLRIRRKLERPLGSVRWKEETPDRNDPSRPTLPTGI